MFDFIKKAAIWEAIDDGLLDGLERKISYQLKTAQDLAIYTVLRKLEGHSIAEIGGGDSRILKKLAEENECTNIEKFEGAAVGPTSEVTIAGVKNIHAFVGEFSSDISEGAYDVLFSISVVEHVPTEELDAFADDVLRVLKPGGRFYHAIDLYLSDEPSDYWAERYRNYQKWVFEDVRVAPIEPRAPPPLQFKCDMASNPDNILFGWRQFAPSMHNLRKGAQNVSLLIGGQKTR